ncbi:ATP-binding cassette domain-containing protein [Psychromonas sp.]|uniref:ATP-binding cassette domain-containing protein n=1 Tax=Psychromonas sp. TaxID=1884585 RepID=UPI003563FE88
MLTISNLSYQFNHKQSDNNLTLNVEELTLQRGESLLVVGDNASGKSLLAQILLGCIKDYSGSVRLTEKHSSLSFELEAVTLEYDRLHDDSEYLEGGVDWGRSARQVICQDNSDNIVVTDDFDKIISLLAIENLLDKPFKILSTGETRKVLMARALLCKPQLLILDEPYAGLDIGSQAQLTKVLNQLIAEGLSIILFDFYHSSLPGEIKKLVYLREGEIKLSGNREEIIASPQWKTLTQSHYTLPHHLPDCISYDHINKTLPLVDLVNVSVSFAENSVFKDLNWQFNQGEHWQIAGPNGSGKSTLLAMISGDSSKAYGQDITLFGVKRGSGESIWDIKRHYGVVGAQLHRDYRVSTNLLHTVLSGFFDSIGLYETPKQSQIEIARQWLLLLGLADKENTSFNALSYGEQRLALIARAVVKLPLILILDEPCQGLDNYNRVKVLALIDYIAANSATHILFVSHDPRDKLLCLTHQLEFLPQGDAYAACVKKL